MDPFAGTGTTLIVSKQLNRNTIGIEIDPDNVRCINERLDDIKPSDNIKKYYKDYVHTDNLKEIWGFSHPEIAAPKKKSQSINLFEL